MHHCDPKQLQRVLKTSSNEQPPAPNGLLSVPRKGTAAGATDIILAAECLGGHSNIPITRMPCAGSARDAPFQQFALHQRFPTQGDFDRLFRDEPWRLADPRTRRSRAEAARRALAKPDRVSASRDHTARRGAPKSRARPIALNAKDSGTTRSRIFLPFPRARWRLLELTTNCAICSLARTQPLVERRNGLQSRSRVATATAAPLRSAPHPDASRNMVRRISPADATLMGPPSVTNQRVATRARTQDPATISICARNGNKRLRPRIQCDINDAPPSREIKY